MTRWELPGGDAVIREDLRPEFRDHIARDLVEVFAWRAAPAYRLRQIHRRHPLVDPPLPTQEPTAP